MNALRDPFTVVSGNAASAGLRASSLKYSASDSFIELLSSHKITLLVSREYEHMVVALSAVKNKLRQSFFHVPHPSGIAVSPSGNSMYIASTRNPNKIVEFVPYKHEHNQYLIPSRIKYYPGRYYLHDLAFIGKTLYANSVGQNGIMPVDFSKYQSENITWWPACVETNGKPETHTNYLQLNSIAAGKSIAGSFFTASASSMGSLKPGDSAFPVDRRGVVFSGRTREVYASGLTRPHSARLKKNVLWLNNSGYGEVGFINHGKFNPILNLYGWTRGLCIAGTTLFVGVSRILPRFKQYAPGILKDKNICGIYAIDMKSGRIIGSIVWPDGNQIFSIEQMPSAKTEGFIQTEFRSTTKKEYSIFYTFNL